MNFDDLPAAFSVRLSTVENTVTMAELERDYDITPESLAELLNRMLRVGYVKNPKRWLGSPWVIVRTGKYRWWRCFPNMKETASARTSLPRFRIGSFLPVMRKFGYLHLPTQVLEHTGFIASSGGEPPGEWWMTTKSWSFGTLSDHISYYTASLFHCPNIMLYIADNAAIGSRIYVM